MRNLVLLVTTAAFLSACGGAGPQSAGGVAPVGSGPGGNPIDPVTGNPHSFVDPTKVVTYQGIGAVQHLERTLILAPSGDPLVTPVNPTDPTTYNRVQTGEFYNSNASTARDSSISITYDPRSAEFSFNYTDPQASTTKNLTYQDPLHRTDHGGAREPQYSVDDFSNAGGANGNAFQVGTTRYLQAGSANGGRRFSQQNTGQLGMERTTTDPESVTSSSTTLFYQKPGTTTSYVTLAGFVGTEYAISRDNVHSDVYERAVFVFGERTDGGSLPTTGSGTFTGPMLATMIFNDQRDTDPTANSFFQWIQGTSTTTVNFADSTFSLLLGGEVNAAQRYIEASGPLTIQQGSTFSAQGNGVIDFKSYGGFQGRFTAASFSNSARTVVLDNAYLSGSSIDGAFFGPAANEVGGSFRLVGGVPDERVDIMGGFVGRK